MRRRLIFLFVTVQDLLVGLAVRNLAVHRALFAPGLEGGRWMVGCWRAWRTFEHARVRSPPTAPISRPSPPTRRCGCAGSPSISPRSPRWTRRATSGLSDLAALR